MKKIYLTKKKTWNIFKKFITRKSKSSKIVKKNQMKFKTLRKIQITPNSVCKPNKHKL